MKEKHGKSVTFGDKPDSVDEVVERVKPFWYYQWFICFVYAYHFVVISTNDGFMIFAGAVPHFKCTDPPYANITPPEGLKKNCYLKTNCSDGNFSYVNPDTNFKSIVMQWDLVCDKAYYADLITTLQMAGKNITVFKNLELPIDFRTTCVDRKTAGYCRICKNSTYLERFEFL